MADHQARAEKAETDQKLAENAAKAKMAAAKAAMEDLEQKKQAAAAAADQAAEVKETSQKAAAEKIQEARTELEKATEERVAEEKVLADKVAIERLASVQATWGDNDAAAEATAEQPAEQEEETPEGPPQDTAQQPEQVEFGDGDGSEQGPAEVTETAAGDGAEQGDGSEQGAVVGTMPGEPVQPPAEEDASEGKTLSDYALLQEAASPHGGKHSDKKMHVEKERAKPNGAKGGSSKGSEGLMELEN